uniref:Uncharacterized protein n=2 Tax=Anguilla anguilla TaxID=7936 RepID=A0A0E9XLC0_ANGAN
MQDSKGSSTASNYFMLHIYILVRDVLLQIKQTFTQTLRGLMLLAQPAELICHFLQLLHKHAGPNV